MHRWEAQEAIKCRPIIRDVRQRQKMNLMSSVNREQRSAPERVID